MNFEVKKRNCNVNFRKVFVYDGSWMCLHVSRILFLDSSASFTFYVRSSFLIEQVLGRNSREHDYAIETDTGTTTIMHEFIKPT